MIALVGNTGFVGSNIYAKGQIDRAYHSTNITDAFGLKPDLLIYAGVRAEKYLADSEPSIDMQHICQAEENIKKIAPKRLVLISTIDVWKDSVGADEDEKVVCDRLRAYGKNRFYLECRIREYDPDALIVRLPGLFGINLKKNFIYDYLNPIPALLKAEKLDQLASKDHSLYQWYERQNEAFYRCKKLQEDERELLVEKFKKLGFLALHFTDSRSIYQFYPMERLWDDLKLALEQKLRLLHLATEPVCVAELYKYLTGREFQNEIQKQPAAYDFRTKYDRLYGGKGGYIMDKKEVMEQIRLFVQNYKNNRS